MLLVAGCTAGGSQQTAGHAPSGPAFEPYVTSSCRPGVNGAEFWIMNSGQLSALQAEAPGSVRHGLRLTNVFVLERPGVTSPVGQTVAYFKSYAAFRTALTLRQIAAGTHWVAYDNEAWSATPSREQEAPVQYETLFSRLAHSRGYKVILMPAQDLVPSFQRGGISWRQYLTLGLASASARLSDIYEIQAQPYEQTAFRQAQDYVQFVRQATAQARAANPNAIVFAGLSTARVTSAADLSQDFTATRGLVSGYWLNIPKDRSTAGASLAAAFLQRLPGAADSSARTCATG
ncbi:MAG TPA: hypothetical protein VGS19_31400 [Streptosporangiaceae bacterium]|nr:hypothetical protein [Streptosporangiaceae bacterium]